MILIKSLFIIDSRICRAFKAAPFNKLSQLNHKLISLSLLGLFLILPTKTSSLLIVSNIEVLKNTFSTGLPYVSTENNFFNRGELGIQGSRPAEIIKLWLGLRFLGMRGIEDVLNSSIERRIFFENNLDTDKYDLYSGPLHIISFLPKGMNKNESDSWTLNKRINLLKKNFMISRPLFKNRYYLRAVFGNYNTSESHINDLLKLLN